MRSSRLVTERATTEETSSFQSTIGSFGWPVHYNARVNCPLETLNECTIIASGNSNTCHFNSQMIWFRLIGHNVNIQITECNFMETHKPFFIDHFAAYYKSNYNDNWPPLPRIIIIQKEMFSPRAASTE